VFWLVNLYSLFIYTEHNGNELPKDSKNSTVILIVTVEVKRSSETSVTLHQSAMRNNAEDSNLR